MPCSKMTRYFVRCALVVPLLAGTLSIAAAQPARPPAPAPVVNVTLPDSMTVSIRDPVPVSLPPKRFPDPAWGLVGVVIGFLLGEGSRLARHTWRINSLKTALRDECESLLSQVPMFIDICEQMVESLRGHGIKPGPAVRGIRTIYEGNIAELAPHLTLRERNLLHVVHEKVRVGDDVIATHQADVLAALNDDRIADPWGSSINRIEELIENYRCVQRLLTSFIEGKPVDVFYVQQTDAAPPAPTPAPSPAAAVSIIPPTFEVARNFLRITGAARRALHGIDLKLGKGLPVLGARGLRPDLKSLHDAIEGFNATKAQVVELRTPAIEKKLSDAFVRVERRYQQADRVVAPYERPEVAPEAWSSNPEFRALAESVRSDVAVLDALIVDLEKLTK